MLRFRRVSRRGRVAGRPLRDAPPQSSSPDRPSVHVRTAGSYPSAPCSEARRSRCWQLLRKARNFRFCAANAKTSESFRSKRWSGMFCIPAPFARAGSVMASRAGEADARMCPKGKTHGKKPWVFPALSPSSSSRGTCADNGAGSREARACMTGTGSRDGSAG